MEFVNALIIALIGSGAFGMLTSLVIQLGKLLFPTWFPNESADNWRLGIIVVTAAVVTILQLFGVFVDLPAIEKFATSFAALGTTLMPLLVLFASWIAKGTYKNLLQGVRWIGKSYTPKIE